MLYFVATPIGNLKDISYRAVETLNTVDVIACEDTRNSLKLLLHYGIKKQLIAYHKNNERESADGIINLLKQGKNIAVISDAGMPVISDPGSILIDKLNENNLEYTVIPGANAGLCALLISGFNAKRFTFVGFLPEKNKDKTDLLQKIKNIDSTLIFYVSPHQINDDKRLLQQILGNRKACLVKEITKLYENKIFFNLGDDTLFEDKGEMVLIIEGNKDFNMFDNMTIDEHIEFYIEQGIEKKLAIKQVAKDRKITKNEVYKHTFE